MITTHYGTYGTNDSPENKIKKPKRTVMGRPKKSESLNQNVWSTPNWKLVYVSFGLVVVDK